MEATKYFHFEMELFITKCVSLKLVRYLLLGEEYIFLNGFIETGKAIKFFSQGQLDNVLGKLDFCLVFKFFC